MGMEKNILYKFLLQNKFKHGCYKIIIGSINIFIGLKKNIKPPI